MPAVLTAGPLQLRRPSMGPLLLDEVDLNVDVVTGGSRIRACLVRHIDERVSARRVEARNTYVDARNKKIHALGNIEIDLCINLEPGGQRDVHLARREGHRVPETC